MYVQDCGRVLQMMGVVSLWNIRCRRRYRVALITCPLVTCSHTGTHLRLNLSIFLSPPPTRRFPPPTHNPPPHVRRRVADRVRCEQLELSPLPTHVRTHLSTAQPHKPQPPSRQTCDQLFEAADSDRSGGIDRTEFSNIVGALCAQILSRIFVYYAVLIFLVPRLAARAVDVARIPNGSYLEMAAEQAISVGLFFAVIPVIWDLIDSRTERRIASKSASSASLSASCTPATEGGPSKAGDDKKDD